MPDRILMTMLIKPGFLNGSKTSKTKLKNVIGVTKTKYPKGLFIYLTLINLVIIIPIAHRKGASKAKIIQFILSHKFAVPKLY